jgi:hypothetical protein
MTARGCHLQVRALGLNGCRTRTLRPLDQRCSFSPRSIRVVLLELPCCSPKCPLSSPTERNLMATSIPRFDRMISMFGALR